VESGDRKDNVIFRNIFRGRFVLIGVHLRQKNEKLFG